MSVGVIKINISYELQLERLKSTYPKNWILHFNHINDNSEYQIEKLNDDYFDFIFNIDKYNENKEIDTIELLNKINKLNKTN